MDESGPLFKAQYAPVTSAEELLALPIYEGEAAFGDRGIFGKDVICVLDENDVMWEPFGIDGVTYRRRCFAW